MEKLIELKKFLKLLFGEHINEMVKEDFSRMKAGQDDQTKREIWDQMNKYVNEIQQL